MSETVTITLKEKQYAGIVTDMDGLFIAGFLLPNISEIIKNETGLSAAFQEFAAHEAQIMQQVSGTEKEALANQLYTEWGERVLIRLSNNLDMRCAFAQRVTEIFPSIPPSIIRFDRWTDREGNRHENCLVRLDVDEAMGIITPIVNSLKDKETAPTAQPVEPKFATIVPPVQHRSEEHTVEELKAMLADAQRLNPRPVAQGFSPA